MAFVNLTPTSTFTQWYTFTNDIGTLLNDQVLANGVVAFGSFTLDPTGNINLCNTFYANSASGVVNGNFSVIGVGNTVFFGNNFLVVANTIVLNPVTSILVNTALTVNATAAFLANITAVNIASSGTISAAALRADGNVTANNGTLVARQVSFTTNGAVVNSTFSSNQNDYTTTGLDDAAVWYANPTADVVLTGLQGHSAVSAAADGARMLFLQNVSSTKKIVLTPANGSSSAVNQFVASGDVTVLPNTTVLLIYTKSTSRWEVVGGSAAGTSGSFTDLTITGALGVGGVATFSANLVAIPLYVNQATGRVGIGSATPGYPLDVVGNANFQSVVFVSDLRATKLSVTSNVAFANIAFAANGVTIFSNYITVNGSAVSFIQNLEAGTILSDAGITATTSVAGASGAFAGAVTANSMTANTLYANLVSANTGTFGSLGVVSASNAVFSRIGVGGAVDANAIAKFVGQYFSPLVAAGSTGTTKTLDWNNGNEQYATMTGSCTFTFSNPVPGGRYVVLLNTGAGSFTATWPSTVRWPGGSAPTLTTASGKLDLFTFVWNDTLSLYFGNYSQNYSAS
jgi:hypothetical protein